MDQTIEQQAAPPPARFDTLPLDAKLIRAVADQGYAFMTRPSRRRRFRWCCRGAT